MHNQESAVPKKIKEIVQYLQEASAKSSQNLIVSFYGGEPLVYFDDMKNFVGSLKGFDFLLTTNGLLLTKDKVEFLNRHCFDVMVSYDGKDSKELRGFDPVADRRNEMLEIDDLSIHTVLKAGSSYADTLCRLEEFNKAYTDKHGYNIKISFAPIVPFEGEDGYGAKDYKKDLIRILKSAKDHPLARRYFENLKQEITDASNGYHPTNLPSRNCRYGTMIPISMDGGIHTCLNRNHAVATIDDKLEDVMAKIAAENMTSRMERCMTCFFNGVTCKNAGCPIQNDDVFDKYCACAKERGKALLEVFDEISAQKL